MIKTRNCVSGEINEHYIEFYLCKKGSYSLRITDSYCRECKPNAICPYGGNIILAK